MTSPPEQQLSPRLRPPAFFYGTQPSKSQRPESLSNSLFWNYPNSNQSNSLDTQTSVSIDVPLSPSPPPDPGLESVAVTEDWLEIEHYPLELFFIEYSLLTRTRAAGRWVRPSREASPSPSLAACTGCSDCRPTPGSVGQMSGRVRSGRVAW